MSRIVPSFPLPLNRWWSQLGCTIRTAYPRIIRGIVGWSGGATALALALDGPRRTAFLLGMLAFLLFYLSLYALRYLVVRRPAPLE